MNSAPARTVLAPWVGQILQQDCKTSSCHHTADHLLNSHRKRSKKTMKRLLTDLASALKYKDTGSRAAGQATPLPQQCGVPTSDLSGLHSPMNWKALLQALASGLSSG